MMPTTTSIRMDRLSWHEAAETIYYCEPRAAARILTELDAARPELLAELRRVKRESDERPRAVRVAEVSP